MKNTYFLISIIFLFSTQFVFSQKSEENSIFKNYSSSIFDQKDSALNFLTTLNGSESNKDSYIKNSGVSIQQIGNLNAASVNVSSKTTSISVNQNGNNNEYNLVKEAHSIAVDVNQNGNNNRINDYSYLTNYDINSIMTQNGNNQNIKNFGSNSISKDMKVIQSGNGASVVIINTIKL